MVVDYWLIPSAANRTGHTQAVISFKDYITAGKPSVTTYAWLGFMNKYILIAAACLSFVAGWQINGWRMGEQIAEINLETAETLKSIAVTAANKQQELQNELDNKQ